jgi:hypothetical protein
VKTKEILALICLPFVLLFVGAGSSEPAGFYLFLMSVFSVPVELMYVIYKIKKVKRNRVQAYTFPTDE